MLYQCSAIEADGCDVYSFDRLAGSYGEIHKESEPKGNGQTPLTNKAQVFAIINSKVLFSGSLLEITLPDPKMTCTQYDWKVRVQANESQNILIYGPAEVGAGVCAEGKFLLALPVSVLWAEVKPYLQNLDPSRETSAGIFGPLEPAADDPKDCMGDPQPRKTFTIAPCDKAGGNFIVRMAYHSGWLYRHLTLPGTAVANIQLTPSASIDYQAEASYWVKHGWLSLPLMYERNSSQSANLDSFIFGLAYNYHPLRRPNFAGDIDGFMMLRKPQFQLRVTPELASTAPHDANLVTGESVKLPFVFNFHKQPSAFTIFPLAGGEQGWHLETHLAEHDNIERWVAGVEGTFRWPFDITHNFLGDTPMTLSYGYKARWLENPEPTAFGNDNLNKLLMSERLAKGRHSYLSSSVNAPFTPYLTLSFTALRGSLPPNFRVVGNTYSLSLQVTTPGSAEK